MITQGRDEDLLIQSICIAGGNGQVQAIFRAKNQQNK